MPYFFEYFAYKLKHITHTHDRIDCGRRLIFRAVCCAVIVTVFFCPYEYEIQCRCRHTAIIVIVVRENGAKFILFVCIPCVLPASMCVYVPVHELVLNIHAPEELNMIRYH